MNKKMLKSKMALNGDTGSTLSEFLGISAQTFSSKINENNGSEFTQSEIEKITRRYGLTGDEVIAIFFARAVS